MAFEGGAARTCNWQIPCLLFLLKEDLEHHLLLFTNNFNINDLNWSLGQISRIHPLLHSLRSGKSSLRLWVPCLRLFLYPCSSVRSLQNLVFLLFHLGLKCRHPLLVLLPLALLCGISSHSGFRLLRDLFHNRFLLLNILYLLGMPLITSKLFLLRCLHSINSSLSSFSIDLNLLFELYIFLSFNLFENPQ